MSHDKTTCQSFMVQSDKYDGPLKKFLICPKEEKREDEVKISSEPRIIRTAILTPKASYIAETSNNCLLHY